MNNQPQIQPPPDAFIDPILKLREHYGQQVEKFELLHRQALENLNHVEALLGAWSDDADASPSITTADEENLAQPSSITMDEPSVNTTQADKTVNPDIAPDSTANPTTTQDDKITQLSFDWPINSTEYISIESPLPNNSNQTTARSLSYSEIPMLPEHIPLSRSEAILKILKQHVGTACHIDFIVRSLYGDLEPDQFKVVKGKVQSALTQGRETNKWFVIPDQPGYYTLILSLIPNSTQSKTSSKPYQDIPLLPEYADMTRTEAIQKFLQQHIGTICHIDFIVIKLYGHLDPTRFKIVRDRVRSTLYYGVAANRWYADPDDPTCYTLDLSLVRPLHTDPSKPKNKTKQRLPQLPQPQTLVVPMLPEFKGQYLIDALTYLLEENPGRIFNVAEVIQAIYGELNAEQLREVKSKVLNELSRGHRTRRFSRVPNETGLYTWDVNLLQQTDSK